MAQVACQTHVRFTQSMVFLASIESYGISHSSYFTKSVAQTSLSSYNAPLIHAHSRHCSVFIAIWLDVILHFTFCHPY